MKTCTNSPLNRYAVLGVCRRTVSLTSGLLNLTRLSCSAVQGLPVFRTGHTMNVSRNDCHFGTKCFQKVTKVKSRTVLQILQLGYHVLFSDVDVYWFQDPSRSLMFYGPGHLAAQTDQYNTTCKWRCSASNLPVQVFQSSCKLTLSFVV